MHCPTLPLRPWLVLCATLALGLMLPVGAAAKTSAPKPPASDGTARAMCKSALVAKSYGDAWKHHDVTVTPAKGGKTVTGRLAKGKKSFEFTCNTNTAGRVTDLTIGPLVAAQ